MSEFLHRAQAAELRVGELEHEIEQLKEDQQRYEKEARRAIRLGVRQREAAEREVERLKKALQGQENDLEPVT